MHPAQLVGWIINNSGSDVSKGNQPEDYSGVEGNITDLDGLCYFLKTKVYKVYKPKLSNVFVIEPKVFVEFVAKGGEHVLHAIFIESNNGVNYKGINSWGTSFPEIMIPMNNIEKRVIKIEER